MEGNSKRSKKEGALRMEERKRLKRMMTAVTNVRMRQDGDKMV